MQTQRNPRKRLKPDGHTQAGCGNSFRNHASEDEKADRDVPEREGETPKERERRERHNRVNLMLRMLRRTGTVDYRAVYGQ